MGFCQQVSGTLKLPRLGGPSEADWVLPRTAIKFVPAEYHSQSAIAAALELRPRIGNPKRIRSIEIATIRTAVEIIGKDPEKWRPQTRETADHSLPYCTAVALVDGQVTAAQFTPRRLTDPALLDLVSRTSVVEDPSLTAAYPEGVPNRVKVTLHDGTELLRELAYPPGHSKNPLTDAQLAAKFHSLVDPVLGSDRAVQIWERASRLESDSEPHEILKRLCRT
jgi:2-methylcitrate dehydratase